MIKQFLILNSRGDTIIFRDFRGENRLSENLCKIQDIFYKKMKLNINEKISIIFFDNLNYIYLRQNGLFFIFTTEYDINPTFILELLYRIIKLIRDFCGVINEDSIRRNFILIYELIDEIIDFGYPQLVNTDQLKYCVYNETKILNNENYYKKDIFNTNNILGLTNTVSGGLSMLPIGIFPTNNITTPTNANSSLNSNTFNGPRTISSNASQRPINPVTTVSNYSTENKVMTFLSNGNPTIECNNEVFIDIFERINLLLKHNGEISRFNIEGGILMKSYLIGQPELTLGFTNDIILKEEEEYNTNNIILKDNLSTLIDDFNFHECVNINEFLQNKVITLKPPEGELIVMNYRISNGSLKIPFKLSTLIESRIKNQKRSSKFDFVIKLKVDIPDTSFATNLILTCPLPKKISNISLETIHPLLPIPQSSQYDDKDYKIIWKIKKIQGGSEIVLKSKINLSFDTCIDSIKKEIGPLYLNFEIPMFNLSNIQVKYLKISEKYNQSNNYRWVRYVTQSNSYIYRLF